MTEKPKRRWLRFSLRTFLVALTTLCLWLGWWSQSALKQKRAVKKLEGFNVSIGYDFEAGPNRGRISPIPGWTLDAIGYDFFHSVVEVHQHSGSSGTSTKAILEELRSFPSLKELRLSSYRFVTDGDLEFISHASKLEVVRIYSRSITTAGLINLSKLSYLRRLHLSGMPITAEGVEVISRLPALSDLRLNNVTLDEATLSRIGEMTRLKTLELHGQRALGDDDLRHFFSLVNLEQLELPDCQLTAAGLARLQKSLPKCAIGLGSLSEVK